MKLLKKRQHLGRKSNQRRINFREIENLKNITEKQEIKLKK